MNDAVNTVEQWLEEEVGHLLLPVFGIRWPTYRGPAPELVGTADNGRVTVYVDAALGDPGMMNAQALLADASRVVIANDALFGTLGKHVNVLIYALGGMTDGTGGADHASCNYLTGGNIEVDAAFGLPKTVSALFEAELSECSMGGRLCGLSTGEALSRWCAMHVAGTDAIPRGFGTAQLWFKNGMANWINQTAPTDQSPIATGCGMAYLSWLQLSNGLDKIAPKMVHLGNAGTLAQLYAALTGEDPALAWPNFEAAVRALPGVTSDDPFGVLAPVA